MKVETKIKIDPSPRRERCGDCFYNGNCRDYLRKCPYLKKIKQIESEDE